MTTEVECKELILTRLGELIPTATASTLPKLAQALAQLKSEDALTGMMDKYIEVIKKNQETTEENCNALIQRLSK